jgi:membrane protein
VTLIRTLRERVGIVTRRVSRDPRARETRAVMTAFGESGGSLLAAGLAFNALFAIIPAMLAMVGVLGFVVGDRIRAEEIVQEIVSQLPALTELIETLLRNLLEQRDAFSIIGLVGFLWGASGFYGSLDEAMRRLFPGGLPRGVVEQRIRGVIAVLGLVGAALATVVAASLFSLLEAVFPLPGDVAGIRILSTLATLPIFVAVVWVTYVIVPVAGPGPRTALLPAVAAGIGIGLLTALFSGIAPFLIGQLAGIGVLAAVFSALVWMRLAFELLIYGGAWARVRRDRARRLANAPTLDTM